MIALMNKKTWQNQRERLTLQQWTRYARILQRITMGKVIKTCNNNDMQQQSRKHKFFIALYCTKSRIVNKRFSQTAKTWVFTQ